MFGSDVARMPEVPCLAGVQSLTMLFEEDIAPCTGRWCPSYLHRLEKLEIVFVSYCCSNPQDGLFAPKWNLKTCRQLQTFAVRVTGECLDDSQLDLKGLVNVRCESVIFQVEGPPADPPSIYATGDARLHSLNLDCSSWSVGQVRIDSPIRQCVKALIRSAASIQGLREIHVKR